MKLSTLILALMAASIAYAKNSNILKNYLNKRELSFDENAFDNISEQCDKELDLLFDCTDYPVPDTYDEVCSFIMSEKCQKMFDNLSEFFPNCKDYPYVMSYVNIAKLTVPINYLTCQKDEAGNPCPISLSLLDSFEKQDNGEPLTFQTEEQLSEIINRTCQSKVCRNATYKTYSKFNENIEKGNQIVENTPEISGHLGFSSYNPKSSENLLRQLNSDECKASNAASIKIGYSLIFILSLLLLSFF